MVLCDCAHFLIAMSFSFFGYSDIPTCQMPLPGGSEDWIFMELRWGGGKGERRT